MALQAADSTSPLLFIQARSYKPLFMRHLCHATMYHAHATASDESAAFQSSKVAKVPASTVRSTAVSTLDESGGLLVGWRIVGMSASANIHWHTAIIQSCHILCIVLVFEKIPVLAGYGDLLYSWD